MRQFWRKYHKWVGLFFTFFILMFCLSGIVLNHRQFFAGCDISRSWMPKGYQYKNWNNGAIRGTYAISPNKVLCYGNAGIWQTDSCFSVFHSYNEGLKEGADHRKISSVVRTPDGTIWCAGLYDLYQLDYKEKWVQKTFQEDTERLADLTVRQDTLIVLSRSYVYEALPPYKHFVRHELQVPEDYSPKVSLFRTVWVLHSGELFGLPGRLFVDLIAGVIIILCITGIVFFFLPYRIRWKSRRKRKARTEGRLLKFNLKWHNRLGSWLIVFTLILAMTGMCLRPPLMIPLAMSQVNPVPGSCMDPDNVWQNKFRGIRWDNRLKQWILGTSSGFYALQDFNATPVRMQGAPPVSPMGLNVFHPTPGGEWLVGSFSGLYRWDAVTGRVTDYYTGKPYAPHGYGSDDKAVSGLSTDLALADELVFEYDQGATVKNGPDRKVTEMPEEIAEQPMSLWNFALELHVGRCYAPLLGPLSSLFVFLSGLLLTLILISGYIIRQRKKTPRGETRAKK